MRGLLLEMRFFFFDPRIFRKIDTQKQDHPPQGSVGFRERG
jgi:hypothetical protein